MKTKRADDLGELKRMVAALRVDPADDKKPRGAARETWPVGFNDALNEVLTVLDQWARTRTRTRKRRS